MFSAAHVMFFTIEAATAIIAVFCLVYLLSSPKERDTYFQSRFIGKLLFPKSGRDERLKRLAQIAGIILFIILVAAFLVLLFKLTSRTH